MKAKLTVAHGHLRIGQRGTIRTNKKGVIVRNELCTGLMTPDYFFTPEACSYEFGVRAHQVSIETSYD